MTEVFSTTVKAVGGRAGTVKSDGLLDLALAMPVEAGGKGGATNPEQLFAAGYAACFGNAVILVGRNSGHPIKDADIEVNAKVGLAANGAGGFGLTVALDVVLAGVDLDTANRLVDTAHQVCPYSNAIRGNIDVALTVRVK